MEKDEKNTPSEPKSSEQASFDNQLNITLEQSVEHVREYGKGKIGQDDLELLNQARQKAAWFSGVPQIIWRLSNYVFSRPGTTNKVSEGMLFGLKRIVLAVANDKVLGNSKEITTVRVAVESVGSDVIAASAVIHAIYRKLQSYPHQAVWGPIFDDALIRTQIGYFAGKGRKEFGSGRGMLAGLSGRLGLAVLIGLGEPEQAQEAIQALARGSSILDVSKELYECDPIQVAAMVLAAAGCGRDAVVGISAYSFLGSNTTQLSTHESRWYHALTLTELCRAGSFECVSDDTWEKLGFDDPEERQEFQEIVKTILRRGHGWQWMM